jgi:hypothetical protein
VIAQQSLRDRHAQEQENHRDAGADNCNRCDAAAGDAGDFRGGRPTCETGAEGTRGAAARIFSSPACWWSACAEESGSFAEWSENFSERAEPGGKAELSLPVEVFRKSLKAF